MTEEQHKWLLMTVRDLDEVIPYPEAAVQITSDENEIYTLTATQDGYLRLGMEMLKAATLTPCERDIDDSMCVDVDLSRLIAPANEVYVETFRMADVIPPLPPQPYVARTRSWSDRLTSFFLTGLCCFLVFALFIGIGTIVSFLLEILHG